MKVLARFALAAVAIVAIIAVGIDRGFWYLRTHSGFYVPSQCEASADARREISSKLTAEQARTLKAVATLTDEDGTCSLTFTYAKDGRIAEVTAIVDAIHGLKFSWDDYRDLPPAPPPRSVMPAPLSAPAQSTPSTQK
jgi:hypothetical protein